MAALTLGLLKAQRGRCARCGTLLLHAEREPQSPEEWELWLRTTRKAISSQQIVERADGASDGLRFRLTHTHCQRRHDA